MNTRFARRTGAALGGAAVIASLLVAPTMAGAAPLAAEQTGGACEITGGTLTWGLKESFRSYISGSIANGSWETSDGAEYETPNFIWSDASGEIDPSTGTGTVHFTGAVHFTGHDGVLDLTLANPTIEFEGDGVAALLLDAKSTDMEGEVSVDAEQEWVGAVTVADRVAPVDDALELSELPTKLTNSGAGAFAGFYEADSDLDPLHLALEFDGCESSAAPVADAADAAASGTEEATGTADAAASADPVAQAPAAAPIPWLPIGIGGAALFVIGLTVGLLISGRKPAARPESGPAAQSHPANPGAVPSTSSEGA